MLGGAALGEQELAEAGVAWSVSLDPPTLLGCVVLLNNLEWKGDFFHREVAGSWQHFFLKQRCCSRNARPIRTPGRCEVRLQRDLLGGCRTPRRGCEGFFSRLKHRRHGDPNGVVETPSPVTFKRGDRDKSPVFFVKILFWFIFVLTFEC